MAETDAERAAKLARARKQLKNQQKKKNKKADQPAAEADVTHKDKDKDKDAIATPENGDATSLAAEPDVEENGKDEEARQETAEQASIDANAEQGEGSGQGQKESAPMQSMAAGAPSSDAEHVELQSQLSSQKSTINLLVEEKGSLSARVDELERALEEAEQGARREAEEQGRNKELQSRIDSLEKERAETEKKMTENDKQRAEKEEKAAALVSTRVPVGSQLPPDMIMSICARTGTRTGAISKAGNGAARDAFLQRHSYRRARSASIRQFTSRGDRAAHQEPFGG